MGFQCRIDAGGRPVEATQKNVPATFPPRFIAELPPSSDEKGPSIITGVTGESSGFSRATQNVTVFSVFSTIN
jgi:hypothetical protein